jgi:hypothetical protein
MERYQEFPGRRAAVRGARHDLRVLRGACRKSIEEGPRRGDASVNLATEQASVRGAALDGTPSSPRWRRPATRRRRSARPAARRAAGPRPAVLVAGGRRRHPQPAAGAADAASFCRRGCRARLDAAGLAAAAAGDPGPVLAGRALLPRRLEGAARRRRQHGPAGGDRHLGGLRAVGGPAVRRSRRPRHAAPVFRILGGGDHPGAAREVAGRPGQGARPSTRSARWNRCARHRPGAARRPGPRRCRWTRLRSAT